VIMDVKLDLFLKYYDVNDLYTLLLIKYIHTCVCMRARVCQMWLEINRRVFPNWQETNFQIWVQLVQG
jgi:hypothetical protein